MRCDDYNSGTIRHYAKVLHADTLDVIASANPPDDDRPDATITLIRLHTPEGPYYVIDTNGDPIIEDDDPEVWDEIIDSCEFRQYIL